MRLPAGRRLAIRVRVLLQQRLFSRRRSPAKFEQPRFDDIKVSVRDLVEELIDARHSRGIDCVSFKAGHPNASDILTKRVDSRRAWLKSHARDSVRFPPEVSTLHDRRIHQEVICADSDLNSLRASLERHQPGQSLKRHHIVVALVPERRDPTRPFSHDAKPRVGIEQRRHVQRIGAGKPRVVPAKLPLRNV